jgi:hypothetical protein
MLEILSYYLIFGIGFYIGLALKDTRSFLNANIESILRGLLLGIIFWPIGLIIQIVFAIQDLKPKNKMKKLNRRTK